MAQVAAASGAWLLLSGVSGLPDMNNERMEQFPSKVTNALPLVNKFKIKLFCTCKMPEVGSQENMAYCPSCHQWFHKTCEQIPDKFLKIRRKNLLVQNVHSK